MNNIEFRDTIFSTNNDLEIPELILEMQAETCDAPFVCFGEQKRSFKMNGQGVLHFYTDDYRFNTVYDHPEKILAYNPRSIVEPNYSLFNETPVAYGLQLVYKKRWIARALQDKGIRLFVDLNVANKFYNINLLGIPQAWSSFCTRGYEDRIVNLHLEYKLALQIAQGNELNFVIYGGGKEARLFAQKHHCIYVNPVIVLKKHDKSDLQKAELLIKNASLFSGENLDSMLKNRGLIYDRQIEYFNI